MKQKIVSCIASVTLGLASSISWACSYDGLFTNPFSESYPGALDVSIATQLAIRSQKLPSIEKIEGSSGLQRTRWWLNLLVKVNDDWPENTYVYVVDRRLWSRIRQVGTSIDIHVSPPPHEADVWQLSEAALHSLISKALTIDQAINLGVLSRSET
ncbi:hypothetical protein [Vibrio neptunius]|uniref:Lipoprotein n=1 Tax=Vibrio neptunius TaxID=170651 RepID=A0ABS2ZWL0_9VIBR|nr:hypothetical protein [Vibrio neptunius]MBN3491999.1 hypothetical protein [Vibrio neptunius]MBN3514306.1 hypothetical protein [Vibrio neptunius]MBN3548579.1 hypothetical protein [Vibrio neptunius]MBN3576625.1 hypothetical protein [Vibrio neptunius]MCH9870289.1 hypothetical protein [Vibrio neptunius]